MTPATRLVVLFGGRSAEHEVSCVSAASLLRTIDLDRYQVVPVGITTEGLWLSAESAGTALDAGELLPRALAVAGPEVDPLSTLTARDGRDVVVLSLLHGPHGEDGTMQGLLELAGMPYVGSGVLGSALCMDKAKAKEVLAFNQLPQARWIALRDSNVGDDLVARVDAELGWPVFVKPANLGSSVGVSKAADARALERAVEIALDFDEWLLVEESVAGRELEVGVLGNADPEASVVGEVRPSREFYDYDDKYGSSDAEILVPAPVPDDVAAEARRLAVEAARCLRVDGMARVDFFYEEPGRGLLVNEVNTIPGFTPISMYPKLWEASGVPYATLIDRLVELALERHRHRAARVGRNRRRSG